MCVLSCTCEYWFLWKPEEDIESLKVGTAGICELSGKGFGYLTQVLYKNCMLLTTELYLKFKSLVFKKLNETVSIIFLGMKMYMYYLT